jgi:hypothetical protein
MRRPLTIDGSRRAIVPRVNQGSYTIEEPTPTTIPPHTHSADQITAEPLGLLAGDDVQEQLYELDTEKLARSGVQPMLGALDMNHNSVNNVDDLDVEGTATVAENVTLTGGVGAAIVSGVRVQHFSGDAADGEATQDGLERTVYNNEPSKSSIELPSRIDFNPAVTAGVHWALAEGRVGHNLAERALVGVVVSGSEDGLGLVPEYFAVALGWTVFNCIAAEIEA